MTDFNEKINNEDNQRMGDALNREKDVLRPVEGMREIRNDMLNFVVQVFPAKYIFDRFMEENDILPPENYDVGMANDSGMFLKYLHKESGISYYFICFLNATSALNVIFHESLHATHVILEDKGIPVNVDNTEIQAYTQGWIAHEIVEIMDEHC